MKYVRPGILMLSLSAAVLLADQAYAAYKRTDQLLQVVWCRELAYHGTIRGVGKRMEICLQQGMYHKRR